MTDHDQIHPKLLVETCDRRYIFYIFYKKKLLGTAVKSQLQGEPLEVTSFSVNHSDNEIWRDRLQEITFSILLLKRFIANRTSGSNQMNLKSFNRNVSSR